MTTSLRYYLSGQSNYVLGQPILIEFGVENLYPDDVWILKWYTPLEGIKGKIFEVKCDGVDIPYEGMLMKRGNPELDDYVHISPGGSIHTEFDLSNFYPLPVCKECRLKFKGRIYDVVFDQQEVPRAVDRHSPVDVPGNAISFNIKRK